jgi:hypothetical protein
MLPFLVQCRMMFDHLSRVGSLRTARHRPKMRPAGTRLKRSRRRCTLRPPGYKFGCAEMRDPWCCVAARTSTRTPIGAEPKLLPAQELSRVAHERPDFDAALHVGWTADLDVWGKAGGPCPAGGTGVCVRPQPAGHQMDMWRSAGGQLRSAINLSDQC